MPTKMTVHDAKLYMKVNGEWKEVVRVKEPHKITIFPPKKPISQLWKSFIDRRNGRLCRHRGRAE